MASWAEVFGIAFALEGLSFFVEAIFIAIYVYGWDRLSFRMHCSPGSPSMIAGFAGSLFVISVNGWMNYPPRFDLGANARSRPRRSRRSSTLLLARADAHVPGGGSSSPASSSPASTPCVGAARRARPLPPRRLIVPLAVACRRRAGSCWSATGPRARWPRTSRPSWPPSRASTRPRRAPRSRSAACTTTARPTSGSRSRHALAARVPRPAPTVQGLEP